ncbi:hypothetical protein KIN20_014179 [Parelaphostrongylus tenuis]|uniref:Uncharacterized protein n=1 Tax=Parelaphostrongylus tenuis TaxID=148309 RepID=A0AAD5QP37_PARTN|nr:hypothetical protein KIN20_014179 [Parelaphostrongylus tenuis]
MENKLDSHARKSVLKPFHKLSFQYFSLLSDAFINVYQIPLYIEIGVTAIIRLMTCLVIITIVTQILASFLLFCRRRDDYIKSSPYNQVRDAKWRLFLLILFQFVVHILTVPYLGEFDSLFAKIKK